MKINYSGSFEILDEELLELINDFRENEEESPVKSLDEVPHSEILDVLNASGYVDDELTMFMDMQEIKISIAE